MQIKNIKSRKILGSSSSWTIETYLELSDGSFGIASVPGGLSRGQNEPVSLPINDALKKSEELKSLLINKDFDNQKDFDSFLLETDGTTEKSNFGGNTILSLSIAFCKAMARSKNIQTYEYIHSQIYPEKDFTITNPQMMVLIMEGGLHGSGSATIQEFMAIVNSMEIGMEIYNNVKKELHGLGKSTNVGSEGAFSPEGYDNEQVLSLLTGYLHGENIALDVAANSFREFKEPKPLPNYESLIKNYPIASIEDPYYEDDWTNWELFTQKVLTDQHNNALLIVADDLVTTNSNVLKTAIEKNVANGVIVKPNQIGTVYETLEFVKLAQSNNYKIIVSHRGTDTNDDFIADLAIGVNADYTKFGAPARGERVAKYNRLMEILN